MLVLFGEAHFEGYIKVGLQILYVVVFGGREMKEFNFVGERVDRFSSYLDRLYYAGTINLEELQAFRKILDDIRNMFKRLRSFIFFGFIPWFVRDDLNKLSSELTLMEYNVSLISVGMTVAL